MEVLRLIKLENTYHKKRDRFIIEDNVVIGVLVVVRKDFELTGIEDRVINEFESYQVRPKLILRSTKGLYFKSGAERRYLTEQEKVYLINQNEELGEYIK